MVLRGNTIVPYCFGKLILSASVKMTDIISGAPFGNKCKCIPLSVSNATLKKTLLRILRNSYHNKCLCVGALCVDGNAALTSGYLQAIFW